MKYDPNNPLSDLELYKLSEKDFFEYLDSKTEYLKSKTIPLNRNTAKRYAALEQKGNLSDSALKAAREVGKIGEEKAKEKAQKIKKPELNVKYRKSNRTQWF